MSVENGRIVLLDGMSETALILPEQDHISAEVLEKIRVLIADGATVIGRQRPTHAPGTKDQQAETVKVDRLAKKLWGPSEESDLEEIF